MDETILFMNITNTRTIAKIGSKEVDIIDPHLDLEVKTSGDSRFSVFLGYNSKFILGSSKISMEKSIF